MKTKRKSALIAKLYQALKKDRQFRAGVIGVIILLLLVVLAPVLTTYNPFEYGADSLAGIGENGHLLGTNHMGQDVYSMLIYGIRTSLKVALISSLISGALGIIIGGVAGFFGGKVDLVISELINAFLMIPTFFFDPRDRCPLWQQHRQCDDRHWHYQLAGKCQIDARTGTVTT